MTKRLTLSLALAASTATWALPIDWHGKFGIDTTMIDSYRRVNSKDGNAPVNLGLTSNANDGSQEIPLGTGNGSDASLQSYIFSLSPTILINDLTTVKSELTTNYGRGGRMGDKMATTQSPRMSSARYSYNTTEGENLTFTKLYMILYSDTATYYLGRHPAHFGLGAIINSGERLYDRHSSIRDGVTANLTLGNFKISPFWSKDSSKLGLTDATSTREYGLSLLYDNPDRDMMIGLYYSKKSSSPFSGSDYETGTGLDVGKSDVKLTDIYFSKRFKKFKIGLEVPLFTGELGELYGQGPTKYSGKAMIAETEFNFNEKWMAGIDAGQVSGDSGAKSSFNAVYLNPNYQIATLLFRYNMLAVSDPANHNIYDSAITNVTYGKLKVNFKQDKWLWKGAMVIATAEQVANAGSTAYNQLNNKNFTATKSQGSDYGKELDLGFDYQWNTETTLGGDLGYLMTGNFYEYTNTATSNSVTNSFLMQIRAAVNF